jgi:hypothetical protein
MTPEGKVKARLKAMLDKLGIYYFMPATGGYGRSGIPGHSYAVALNQNKFLEVVCGMLLSL